MIRDPIWTSARNYKTTQYILKVFMVVFFIIRVIITKAQGY